MKSKTKTTYIGFKCAPEQKEQIISKCRKYGLSMSEFIRVSCVRSSINIISGIPELTIELSRIGKNFNQIVRAVYLHPQARVGSIGRFPPLARWLQVLPATYLAWRCKVMVTL